MVQPTANTRKIIAEATAAAYKGAMGDLQNKLKRTVEVWKQRQIFEAPIQEAIEARIAGMCCIGQVDHAI